MPIKTQNFKLDYFKQGSYYSASADYRRFFTMDYNMESYIGIIGNGVLSGWTLEQVSGLIIQILPGNGVINGFFMESQYSVKQRSDMVNGDREIEVLNEDDIPEANLTPSQRATYISVVQLYNPSFNPTGDIENSYVKVVVPTQITLPNNSDTYIYAQRPAGAKPYPPLNDYPPPAGQPPDRGDYPDYDSYKVALDIYNAKLDAIYNYEWYNSVDNHFTAVDFVTSAIKIEASNKVLLGRVTTRNSDVYKIDISEVNNIFNLESQIRKYANEYIVAHHHGGKQSFDPPKVRLETDIRDTSLKYFDGATGQTIYNILEKAETSVEMGHKHTYKIDADGNGQTMDQMGSLNPHFHKIANGVVGNPEESVEPVETHTHTILSFSEQGDTTDISRYIVYVNGEVFGDETTPYIHVNPAKKTITFDKGVSASNNQYKMEFDIVLFDPFVEVGDPLQVTRNFTFESREVSVYYFMLKAINRFNQVYIDYFTERVFFPEDKPEGVSNIGIISQNVALNPFLFIEDGAVVGYQDLNDQSSAAQVLLRNKGDSFNFTPNAARNIPITLTEVGHIDEVKIEVLGNTEVTGVLRPESILYVNANKFLLGEFIPEVIPFISHVGRFKEECLPLQYSMVSNDGIRYNVVPTITDSSLGHVHKLIVDKSITGSTSDVLVGNDAVYYQNDAKNNSYLILHYHGITEGKILDSDSNGLLNWQNNVAGTALTSSSHSHNIIYPVIGNNKTIYAIKEDIEGNIYVGTSDGFMVIPAMPSYLFVVNGLELYFYGNDLWELLQKAAAQYEKQTTNAVKITDSIYGSQISKAEGLLINDGDSVLLTGTPYPDRQTDEIMIKKVSSFKMPNFKYVVEKKQYEVLENETIIGTVATENIGDEKMSSVIVERNFEDTPIWSIATDTINTPSSNYIASTVSTDVFVTGSNLVAKSVGLNQSPYSPWNPVNVPFSVGVMRKTIKDYDGNYWICTNNGILVSRYYSAGSILEVTNLPYGNPDVQDIVEGEVGSIYCVSSSGIFKTSDGGKTWSKLFDVINGFTQIVRDMSLDKTNVVDGHYHEFDVNTEGDGFLGESIGDGIKHVHVVSGWQVESTMGHTHTMVTTMYAVDNSKIIWKSTNNGGIWNEYGKLPDGECGNIFASFASIFVSQKDGLYKSSDGSTWVLAFKNKIYSYEWSYDMSELFMGGNNTLYSTFDGISFDTVYSFAGKPYSILLRNGSLQYYGYAYSNISQTFHFKDLVVTSDLLTSLVDFDAWYAQGGSWSTSYPYDVYINYKLNMSTKSNKDNRKTSEFNYSVVPSEGKIDFSASSQLAKPASIYDDSINVTASNSFSVGDSIVIMGNSATYATIAAINSNDITLDSRLSTDISLPSSVTKVPNVDGDSSILVNIYNSLLGNIGTLTHDQVEDGLSNYSDGRPYKFNDSYLSNLLQLTQAVRYVYPDINSEFVNDLFYDFRYSWNPLDPIYPSIYNYIDVVTSEIYNQKIYDSNFDAKGAKSINKILIGYGFLDGKIIVATDIGIFVSDFTESYEANWKYINDLPFTVYDLIIFRGNVLLAATAKGTYTTTDLQTWTLENTPAIYYPSYSLGLRWFDQDIVVVPSHTALFVSNSASDTATITSYSGNVYADLNANQGIKITGAGTKNGGYVIQSIGDGGSGFGSQIIVSPTFSGSDGVISGVIMTMGTWWGQWNGDLNTSNANLTNTLLVGGQDHISFNDGGSIWAWYESSFNGASNFISRKFTPLSNGRVLLAATGISATNQKNYLLKSDDIGKNWSVFRGLEETRGTISSASVSDFNNTVLNVVFTFPKQYIYVNGIMDQQDIAIFDGDSSVVLFRGKVVWNEVRSGKDQIVVYGNSLYSIIKSNPKCTFIVYPSKVNTIGETSEETLFYGTNKGIYYDVNTVVSNVRPEGQINTVGYNGNVSSIDISGNIVSIGFNSITQNTIVYISSDANIRGSELKGQYLYVTDTYPVEKYLISSNGSISPGEESSVEIETSTALTSAYIGKKISIVGSNSRVYVSFDLPVSDNQFKNGTLTVMSSWSNAYGKTYNIVASTTDYVDIDTAITPSSTMVRRVEENEDTTNTSNDVTDAQLSVGDKINVLDASGRLVLWVTLDREIKENSMKNLKLELNGVEASRAIEANIYSNLDNSITVDSSNAASYVSGDNFSIKGDLFEQLGGFSHLLTSIESDHYHGVETVNDIVNGQVGSFGFRNASYVDINVANTSSNFSSYIVQLRPDLFEDAQIVFTNTQYVNLRYISEVVSHTATSIRVRITSSSYWDFDNPSSTKISEGWNWKIDATNYGYTDGTYYDDFIVLATGITDTADTGTDTLKVTNTSGINVGDKIRIQDDTLSFEINHVSQIVDLETLKVTSALTRTFFEKRNPQIKVLRNVFANTHIHQIRNNEVEVIAVSQYLDNGYPAEHSHRVLPLMTDVSVLLNKNNSVLALGSSSIIYSSSDNGNTWVKLVDLNDYVEGSSEVEGVSTAVLNNGNLVVGATNGSLFAEVENKDEIVMLSNSL